MFKKLKFYNYFFKKVKKFKDPIRIILFDKNQEIQISKNLSKNQQDKLRQINLKILNKYNIQAVARDYNIINPNTLRIVSFHQHIISPYSNGNPYILYLTKIDGINCCIYIDKKLKDGYTYPKMHCVKYRFKDEIFEKDTIFSGELVKDNEKFVKKFTEAIKMECSAKQTIKQNNKWKKIL